MSMRQDLETQIAKRLETISAGDMQRLAQEYVRIRFPERFPYFDFHALSPEGKTRDGWPDAYILLDDGSRDGAEATTSKSKPTVMKHLGDDVAKARDRMPKLSGFVFVSGHPAVQPNDNELNDLRRRFVDEAGLEPECVNLVFGNQLVDELAAPEYARTLIEILGIRHLPTWFELVRPDLPPDDNLGDFIPSPDDYKNGRVHRPQDADLVLHYLETTGRVLVRGVGASGKTVLAWMLARETAQTGYPSFYRDMADISDNPEADNGIQEDLKLFAHTSVLFILDNVHLDERMASGLALAWEELPPSQRPRLLLVGRELHTHLGSTINKLDIPTVPLKARQAEVRGVYLRLAGRRSGATEAREPPPEYLDSWVKTFGGDPTAPDTTTDLIAFSAAVLRRLPDLESGDWNLIEKDAVEEIREAYLKKLNKGETRNLMRLAALSEFELALSAQALVDPRQGFDIANRRMGLVFRQTVGGRAQYVVYRLAHAALGKLLLAAAIEPVDVDKEQAALALAHPHTGFALAHKLSMDNQTARTKAILSALMEKPGRLLDVTGLQHSHNALRLILKLKVAPLIKIASDLMNAENRPRLIDLALLTPLHNLKSFLAYAEKTGELKAVFTAIVDALKQEKSRTRLIDQALLTPLGHMQSFLTYAKKTDELEAVFTAIVDALKQEKNRTRLIDRALLTPLGDIKCFLAYAKKTDELKAVFTTIVDALKQEKNRTRLIDRALLTPLYYMPSFLTYAKKTDELEAVFTVIVDALKQEKNRTRLIDRALLTPLDHMQSFLAYAEKTGELKAVFTAIVDALKQEKNRTRLIDRALLTPLGHMQSFLAYAEKTDALKAVFTAIVDALKQEKNRTRLIDVALLTPLDHMQSFLAYAEKTDELKTFFTMLVAELVNGTNRPHLVKQFASAPLSDIVSILSADAATRELWQAIIMDVDVKQWERIRMQDNAPKLDAFVRFQLLVAARGRPELISAPALKLVRLAETEQWQPPNGSIRNLSHVLRCAVSATEEEIGRFLQRIATPDWVDQQVGAGAQTGGLAGSLLALSMTLHPELRSPFLRPSIRRRVLGEIITKDTMGEKAWIEALSLLGAVAALGIRLDSVKTNWPDKEKINAIIESRLPDPEYTAIGHLQVQLWLGLREMCRLRSDGVSVTEKHGDTILTLWRATHESKADQPVPAHVRELNAGMIAWLERCRQAEWRLVKDK